MSSASSPVVIITGASSGIGRATAGFFAARGWKIGLIARGQEGLTATRNDVLAQGGEAAIAIADVSDGIALEQAAEKIEMALGAVDVWINCAGTSFMGRFSDITDEEFRRVTDVTYMGQVNGTRIALRRMLSRDQGTIVNVASAVSYRAFPLQTPYCAAKYALRGFTEGLRAELIHDRSKVHLAIIHPPVVNTPFFSHTASRMTESPTAPPLAYQPELVADAIYFAVMKKRAEVMVGSQTVQLAWLNTLFPRVADWIFGKIGFFAQLSKSQKIKDLRDPNLFQPGQRAHGIRGPYRAFGSSTQMWATKNRELVAVTVGVAAMLALYLRRSNHDRKVIQNYLERHAPAED